MRHILTLALVFGLVSFCYADRICIEKSTGKIIELQSGNALLGTLTKNAVNSGYKESDVQEKYITDSEWKVIEQEQIIKPREEMKKQEEAIRKNKEDKIKQKLNLSDNDWKDLKDALNKNDRKSN